LEELFEKVTVVCGCISAKSRLVVIFVVVITKGWNDYTVGEKFNH
jgi:hypothetical protein